MLYGPSGEQIHCVLEPFGERLALMHTNKDSVGFIRVTDAGQDGFSEPREVGYIGGAHYSVVGSDAGLHVLWEDNWLNYSTWDGMDFGSFEKLWPSDVSGLAIQIADSKPTAFFSVDTMGRNRVLYRQKEEEGWGKTFSAIRICFL
ncbi:MAG: hypothetical protein SWK76_09165 [Actinomycetota bacterium]|nr:hypothetical protein [Actinomycetota bacterium]